MEIYYQIDHFEIPHKIDPTNAHAKPKPRIMKLFLPFISLYKNIPHKADIADGPLDTIGNVIACVRALLAKKKRLLAIPHIQPLIIKKF